MKLNEYLYDRLLKAGCIFGAHHLEVKEEDIEKWIVDWYMKEFDEIGCGKKGDTKRAPPTWLANWRKNGKHQ